MATLKLLEEHIRENLVKVCSILNSCHKSLIFFVRSASAIIGKSLAFLKDLCYQLSCVRFSTEI